MNWAKIRNGFPLINNHGSKLIYFDNAATTQKPQEFIDSLVEYYSTINSNIHRGNYQIALESEKGLEETRSYIAMLYHCLPEEVVFTKNDTEGINIIANGLLGRYGILNGKKVQILIPKLEHHANIVPWQMVAKSTCLDDNLVASGFDNDITYINFSPEGEIDLQEIIQNISQDRVNIICLNWVSNTLGSINDIKEIIKVIRAVTSIAYIVVDAAQFVPYSSFDFRDTGADFIVFSAHKLCGPTGVGVLIGRKEVLDILPPYYFGGDMIESVGLHKTSFKSSPHKFEAGTPNIADIVAFKSSLVYLNETIGFTNIKARSQHLYTYLLSKLMELDFVTIFGSIEYNQNKRVSIISFNIKGVHPHDAGSIYADKFGIAVRTGAHCTHLLLDKLGVVATIRASLYFYNTIEEIDIFINATRQIYKLFTE